MLRMIVVAGIMSILAGPAGAVVKCADIPAQKDGPLKGSVLLSQYQMEQSCQVADKTFSDFSETTLQMDHRAPTTSAQTGVKPLNDANDPGLEFNGYFNKDNDYWEVTGKNAGRNALADVFQFQIYYTVKAPGDQAIITGASLELLGLGFGGSRTAAVKSRVNVTETLSNGKTLSVTDGIGLNPQTLKDSTTFPGVNSLTVTDVITLTATAGPNGFAELKAFSNQFAETPVGMSTPEPSAWTMMLVGCGLSGAAIRRRRSCEQAARLT